MLKFKESYPLLPGIIWSIIDAKNSALTQEERKMNKQKKIGLAVLVVILLYAAISVFFQYHYFIGTKVNGYSCGFRSVSKTKELIKEDVKAYKITIKERYKK